MYKSFYVVVLLFSNWRSGILSKLHIIDRDQSVCFFIMICLPVDPDVFSPLCVLR